jgi:hypothetical protein
MKKNINSQVAELLERIETMESSMDELTERVNAVEPLTKDEDDENEEVSYKFTEEEFSEFIEAYTIHVKQSLIEEISEMDMDDDDSLYDMEIDGKEISVNLRSTAVSSFIEENLETKDDSDMVEMAQEMLNDLGIEYTIH